MSFGESLMNTRKARGISRKEFAEQLQIPYTTLRNYETDQREPGHKLLINMATILDVSVDELIGHHVQVKISPSTDKSAPREEHLETSPLRSTLLHNFDQLNQEGQERLVETSDDMVSSGKYKKSDSDKLGSEKFA